MARAGDGCQDRGRIGATRVTGVRYPDQAPGGRRCTRPGTMMTFWPGILSGRLHLRTHTGLGLRPRGSRSPPSRGGWSGQAWELRASGSGRNLNANDSCSQLCLRLGGHGVGEPAMGQTVGSLGDHRGHPVGVRVRFCPGRGRMWAWGPERATWTLGDCYPPPFSREVVVSTYFFFSNSVLSLRMLYPRNIRVNPHEG